MVKFKIPTFHFVGYPVLEFNSLIFLSLGNFSFFYSAAGGVPSLPSLTGYLPQFGKLFFSFLVLTVSLPVS